MLTSGYELRHAPEARTEDIEDFEKSQSRVLRSEGEGWLSLARRSQASGLVAGAHVMGDRWKSHHRKIVHLSSLCWNL